VNQIKKAIPLITVFLILTLSFVSTAEEKTLFSRLESMGIFTDLNLTKNQQKQMEKIFQKHEASTQDLRNELSALRKEKKELIKMENADLEQIREKMVRGVEIKLKLLQSYWEIDREINQILNQEQKEIWEQKKEEFWDKNCRKPE